jgi:putative transposase
MPAGTIEHLEVPRDREGEFVSEVFERYKRTTGNVEEAILEMYLSGISVRKIAGVPEVLCFPPWMRLDTLSNII